MKERTNESWEQLHVGYALIMETNENLKMNKMRTNELMKETTNENWEHFQEGDALIITDGGGGFTSIYTTDESAQ